MRMGLDASKWKLKEHPLDYLRDTANYDPRVRPNGVGVNLGKSNGEDHLLLLDHAPHTRALLRQYGSAVVHKSTGFPCLQAEEITYQTVNGLRKQFRDAARPAGPYVPHMSLHQDYPLEPSAGLLFSPNSEDDFTDAARTVVVRTDLVAGRIKALTHEQDVQYVSDVGYAHEWSGGDALLWNDSDFVHGRTGGNETSTSPLLLRAQLRGFMEE